VIMPASVSVPAFIYVVVARPSSGDSRLGRSWGCTPPVVHLQACALSCSRCWDELGFEASLLVPGPGECHSPWALCWIWLTGSYGRRAGRRRRSHATRAVRASSVLCELTCPRLSVRAGHLSDPLSAGIINDNGVAENH
jgi:hypothetical protein